MDYARQGLLTGLPDAHRNEIEVELTLSLREVAAHLEALVIELDDLEFYVARILFGRELPSLL